MSRAPAAVAAKLGDTNNGTKGRQTDNNIQRYRHLMSAFSTMEIKPKLPFTVTIPQKPRLCLAIPRKQQVLLQLPCLGQWVPEERHIHTER